MTYVMYLNNGKWVRTLREANWKPEKTIYVEHLEYNNTDISYDTNMLLEDINKNNYFTGMHGLKINKDMHNITKGEFYNIG